MMAATLACALAFTWDCGWRAYLMPPSPNTPNSEFAAREGREISGHNRRHIAPVAAFGKQAGKRRALNTGANVSAAHTYHPPVQAGSTSTTMG